MLGFVCCEQIFKVQKMTNTKKYIYTPVFEPQFLQIFLAYVKKLPEILYIHSYLNTQVHRKGSRCYNHMYW